MSSLYNWIKDHKFISSVSAILLILIFMYIFLMIQFFILLKGLF